MKGFGGGLKKTMKVGISHGMNSSPIIDDEMGGQWRNAASWTVPMPSFSLCYFE